MRRQAPPKPKLIVVSNRRLSMPDVGKPFTMKCVWKGDELRSFLIWTCGNKWPSSLLHTISLCLFWGDVLYSVWILPGFLLAETVGLFMCASVASLRFLLSLPTDIRTLWGNPMQLKEFSIYVRSGERQREGSVVEVERKEAWISGHYLACSIVLN